MKNLVQMKQRYKNIAFTAEFSEGLMILVDRKDVLGLLTDLEMAIEVTAAYREAGMWFQKMAEAMGKAPEPFVVDEEHHVDGPRDAVEKEKGRAFPEWLKGEPGEYNAVQVNQINKIHEHIKSVAAYNPAVRSMLHDFERAINSYKNAEVLKTWPDNPVA